MHIDTLKNFPEYLPSVAKWIYQAFPQELSNLTLEDWTAQVALSQGKDWTTLIAVKNEQGIGTASLDKADLPPSPWLASVYVLPEARSKGLGLY